MKATELKSLLPWRWGTDNQEPGGGGVRLGTAVVGMPARLRLSLHRTKYD
jgi:hypothetical protein